MEDNKPTLIKPIGKIPRSKDNAFDLRQLSMREFEAFMILLMHEGEEQSILKQLIDIEFDHTSSTKGYDYINNLCKDIYEKKTKVKGKQEEEPKIRRRAFAYKKKTKVEGKQVIRIYVKPIIRKKYEKFILPTVSSLKESLQEIFKEYIDGIKVEEKIRDKFKAFTETIILALKDLITDTPVKTLRSKRFQKKIYDMIWKYYRSEVLKYEVFSK